MSTPENNFEPLAILDRICQVYEFNQKVQLANHFGMSASSLSNRYTRGNVSYDLAVLCALETSANISWLMTGKGEAKPGSTQPSDDIFQVELFTLSEGRLLEPSFLSISNDFFSKRPTNAQCVREGLETYVIEKNTSLSDGSWLIDIDESVSIRELTVLPGKRLHVAGGKIPFECSAEEIKLLGRVVGIYSEAK